MGTKRTPQLIEPEAGKAVADAIIDALEYTATKLSHAVRALQEDHAEAREELTALKQRVEALETRARSAARQSRGG